MNSKTPHLFGHHRPLRKVIHCVALDVVPSETDISEMVANCHLDLSQQMLNRIPATLRLISDAGVDVA